MRTQETDVNRAAIQRVLAEELTATVGESAEHRRPVERSVSCIGPGDVPLVGLGVVEAESHPFDVAGRTADVEFAEICAAIPNFSNDRRALVFQPARGSRQRTIEPRQERLPRAEFEIKIVLPITLRLTRLQERDDDAA